MNTSGFDIKVDRPKALDYLRDFCESHKEFRVSDHLLKLLCGKRQPTEELEAEMKTMGLRISAGLDQHAGWSVRLAGEQEVVGSENWSLF